MPQSTRRDMASTQQQDTLDLQGTVRDAVRAVPDLYGEGFAAIADGPLGGLSVADVLGINTEAVQLLQRLLELQKA